MPARIAVDRDRAELGLMLALTFTTGIVDAIGFLGLDRVFTANMTGNVVILGMALTGADSLPVLGPALALVGFMLGALLSGRLLRTARPGWSGRTTSVLAACGAVPAALGALSLAETPAPHTPLGWTVTGLLGFVMGAQAAAARRIGVKDVTTVVITSTITGLAADARLAGGTGDGRWRRLGAIVLMLLGAAAGALLLLAGIGVSMIVAGGLILVVVLAGHVLRPRRAEPSEE